MRTEGEGHEGGGMSTNRNGRAGGHLDLRPHPYEVENPMPAYQLQNPKSTDKYGDNRLPEGERHLNRAILAALAGRDYRRHIARARTYARLAESEEFKTARREEINQAVEAIREQRRRAARI
jgi:hypothetical protein